MKDFADLCNFLDQATTSGEEILLLSKYLREADPGDRLWAIELLLGKRPQRVIPIDTLKIWAIEYSNLPDWLVEESMKVTTSVTEGLSLILPKARTENHFKLSECISLLQSINDGDEPSSRKRIENSWACQNCQTRLVFNKLLTATFRTRLSRKIVAKALADITGIEEYKFGHRLTDVWSARESTYFEFVDGVSHSGNDARPYLFQRVGAMRNYSQLGSAKNWKAEQALEGVRCQLICRNHQVVIWSENAEMVSDRFPEFSSLHERLPDGTVIDGTIVDTVKGQMVSSGEVKKRLNAARPSKKMIRDHPACFIAFDLLEREGQDIRSSTFLKRRSELKLLVLSVQRDLIKISDFISFTTWEEIAHQMKSKRSPFRRGLIMKHVTSPYNGKREIDGWWKWNPIPFRINTVLMYVGRGMGSKPGAFSEFGLGVWNGDQLVTIARIGVDLTDVEANLLREFVEECTVDRFGPVRTVAPKLVFEITFKGIRQSRRHKSGITLQSPKFKKWNRDETADNASQLKDLQCLFAGKNDVQI